jgi:hypothetical protein
VDRLVRHCAGRVRYWQCDNEPSNVGRLWAGTAAEYVAQLKVMYQAVKDADPDALVVLGGAPFGLPESPPDSPDRQFFDVLLTDGRDAFDLFDLHLYGEASRIPADIETARGLMRPSATRSRWWPASTTAPWPNLYPEAVAAMQAAMASLNERMPSLPPQLQMFMRGCPPELEAKRHRINCREVVMRNLLALASGVRRPICWNLAPEIPGYENHLSVMDLLFGKLALLDYEGTELSRRHPAADTFALVAGRLTDVDSVVRVEVPGRPSLYLFEVRRRGRGPLLVVWDQRDSFSGEDDPPVAFDWPWPEARAAAVDAFGQPQPAEVRDGRVHLEASITPLLVTAG